MSKPVKAFLMSAIAFVLCSKAEVIVNAIWTHGAEDLCIKGVEKIALVIKHLLLFATACI